MIMHMIVILQWWHWTTHLYCLCITLPCKWDTTWTQMWFWVRASGFQGHGECTEGGTHECSPTERGRKYRIRIIQRVSLQSDGQMHTSLEVLRVTWTAGAAERASVKQIMHMSSASCFRQPVFLSQPCRHGRQVSSFFTPPQGCPQGWVLLQANLEYSWGAQCERDWWSFWWLLEF